MGSVSCSSNLLVLNHKLKNACNVIQLIHDTGIVFRDIKPGDFMFGTDCDTVTGKGAFR